MAFRKKAEKILDKNPDILIVPECENLDKLIFPKGVPLPQDSYWYGLNPHKGIGVFSYSDYTITLCKEFKPDFKFIIPLIIQNEQESFILMAFWCQKPEKTDNYGIQTWEALKYYSKLLKSEKIILAGDFNSNTIWDKPNREANHSNIVKKLRRNNIESLYHLWKKEEQGKESSPTLFLHRKPDRPYHLDYCFASEYFVKRLKKVEIGGFDKWIEFSDHMPIILEIST